LAQTLNVSLGLVNSFVRRLAQKGYFKIKTIPRNRIRYILTPKGFAEKARLTSAYIDYSFKMYRSARSYLRQLFSDLKSQQVKTLVFGGVNDITEIGYLFYQESSLELVAVVDDEQQGKTFFGFDVEGSDRLSHITFDRLIVFGNPEKTLKGLHDGLELEEGKIVFIDM
jgi:DNA-binding MarR family transcriptional regulator